MSMINVGIIFSGEHSRSYNSSGFDKENIQALEIKAFSTSDQANAYILGVDEASGFTEYELADEQQLVDRNLNPLLSVVAVFGRGAVIRKKPSHQERVFTFNSAEERKAFEQGLDDGNGWEDYCQPSDEDLAAYLVAREQIGPSLTIHSFEIELTNGDLVTIKTFWEKDKLTEVLSPLHGSIKHIRDVAFEFDEYDYLDISPEDHVSLLEKFKLAIDEK